MKITILTDLLEGHKEATFGFVKALPHEMNFDIELVTIIEPSFGGDSLILNLSNIFMEEAKEEMASLSNELESMTPEYVNIKTNCIVGTFKNKLLKHLNSNPADLLVMFGRNKHGLEKLISSKKSIQMLGRISIPTLIIPIEYEDLKFDIFGAAVHQKETIPNASIAQIQELVRFFHADSIVFHVDDLTEDDLHFYEHNKKLNKIATQEVEVVRDFDIVNGINTAVSKYNIDVLIGITHKKSWIENLTKGNTIATILKKNEYPLLILSK